MAKKLVRRKKIVSRPARPSARKTVSRPRPTGTPKVGAKAPAFAAPASNGRTVRLSEFEGRVVVLYFYPKDHTSGCTVEACEFRDAHAQLTQAGVVVLGVSPDSVKSHEGFIRKHDLPFVLLADEDRAISRAYGVWRQKSLYGRKYMGVARTTFIIDRSGRIAHVFENVKAAGHAEAVRDWIAENL